MVPYISRYLAQLLITCCLLAIVITSGAQSQMYLRDTDPLNTLQKRLGDTLHKKLYLKDALLNQSFKKPVLMGQATTCNTSTFYMHLAAATGEKVNVTALQTLTTDDFIVGGNITHANKEQEGLLCVLSNTGNLLSQKEIRINNKPTTLYGLQVLINNHVVLAGVVHDSPEKAFIAMVDPTLSTLWIKTVDLPANASNVTISTLQNGQLAMAVQIPGAIYFSLFGNDGTLIFQEQVTPAGLTQLVDFGESLNLELCLVYNCTRSSKQLAEIVQLHPDGTVVSTGILPIAGDENKYAQTKSFGQRMLGLGVVKKASGQFRLVRDILSGSDIIETEHEYTIPGNVDFKTTCAMDNAGDVMGFCLPDDGKLVFLRHFAYYQTSPEHTRRYTVPKGSEIVSVARSGADEGFLFGLNNAAANEIILIKTDSIGTLAGCGFEDINNQFDETINRSITPASASATSTIANVVPGVVSSKTINLSSKTDCNQTYCPAAPIDDTCLSSYFKLFRSNSYAEGFGSYHLMRNNNHLLVTAKTERVFSGGNQQTYSIKLLNERGDFIKGVRFFVDSVNTAASVEQIDDQHFIIITYAPKDGKVGYAFTLMNDNLDILWTKAIQAVGNYPYYSGGSGVGDFIADQEGNFYFVANSLGFYERPKVLVHKMDSNGNPVWTKSYEMEQGEFLTSSATTTSTSLIVVMEGNSLGSVSARIDKKTGEMLNAFIYNNTHDGSVYRRTLKYSNGSIFYAGNNAASRFTMGIFDTIGRPVKFQSFSSDVSIVRAATAKDGKLYAMYQYFNGSVLKDILLKADSSLALEYMNEFDIIRYGLPVGIGVSDNGSVYEGSNYFYGGVNGSYVDAVLKKFDSKGRMGTCSYKTATPGIIDIDLKTLPQTFDAVPYSFVPIDVTAQVIPDANGLNISEILCSSKQNCNFIDVTGKNVICDTTKTYTYRSLKNTGCTLQPLWIYDTTFARLKSVTDSAADFTFKKPGSIWLKSVLNAGCKIYTDSLLVQIQNTQSSFSLGKDTSICRGDSLLLKAGAGYNNYSWQDGSAGATFMVKKAGIYFVAVNNLCGDKYADTIEVKESIVPNLSIGNDSSVCLLDSVQITASTGFKTYTWQSSGNISSQANKAVIVVVKDETVTLKAITAEGCNASDTLKLTGIKARPFSLGNDTSFCAGNSITLLTSGYSKYLWSTGSLGNSITVNTAGKYWLLAQDNNGCYAKDTMEIKNVYPLPVVNLGNDFNVCKGQTRRLDAGTYAKYLWQDGSVNRYYTTTAPSLIWVKVTSDKGCTTADSVTFTSMLPVPANFLKPTDSICQYEQVTITPMASFNSYQWSTGSTKPTLLVDAPGRYILTVTDASGCAGKDTIEVIQKNCFSGVYVPTAFTPNGDALNDVFRARVYGAVISFRMQVYNRFGEIVFTTTNPLQGWNGTVKGKLESSGAFVFHCSYQLAGSSPGKLQGTVMLIR